ncbi:O-antigen ligase family protein [Erythrobacter sp. SG61-1L]|uniref:O-antigen ligase family protein n=1 Tax=Erythrobacter sp. SG61-1L TaxID=1603897 RepID=UPI0019D71A68|nr:O-antigen ligase family protein [Erythrobacter sp. SG61-1L]
MILLIMAFLLGGGGTPSPLPELSLELLAGLTMLAWIWLPGPVRLPTDPALWTIAALAIAVPALQLVPLPPDIWQALPGREAQAAALALVGEEDSWRPLSMSPPRTLASLLSLVPPLTLMLMAGALQRRQRRILLAAILLMALASALIGAFQISAGGRAFRFYSASHATLVGFQANRNATADILLIGMLALAAYAAGHQSEKGQPKREAAGQRVWWLAGAALLLVLASIFTASRTGIALILPVGIAAWAILALDPRKAWNRRLPVIAGGALAVILGGLFLLRHNLALQQVAGRFDRIAGDGREGLWRDTLYAVCQYWPFGSGMGTFVPTFVALEPLEAVDAGMPNRAHNDYLELALEAGVFGIAALALTALLVLFMAVRAWRRERQDRVQIAFGMAVLAVIAAHSLVDYPLRSLSLACLAALAVAMLARPPRDRQDRP